MSCPGGLVGYDQAGNITSDQTSGNSYTYDAEGRVCAVRNEPTPGTWSMTGYIYDAVGNRVAKGTITSMSCDSTANGFTFTENYVLGPSGEELSMFDGGNNWQRTNVYADSKLVGTYDTGGLHFHLEDPLGTRRMQLSGNPNQVGLPETDIQSWPYGDQLYSFPDQYAPATADDATPLHFTGKERDAESGNDYFGARYFASTMGRFLSPDWSAKAEPVPYAKLGDPQSLNLYAYVRNNPLSRIDADGHYDFANSGCGDNAKCQKKYDKREDKFEKRREKDLNSKHADVRAAAAAYGARGEANGVHVGFADTHGAENGDTNPFHSTPGNIDIRVTIDNSRVGSDTQEHEGAHVADDTKFLNSYDPAKGGYDQSLNFTHGQTEFNGLKVGAEIDGGHGLNPNNPQQIWDFIRNSPVYGPVMNNLVFPPALFPGPTGPED